MAEANLCDWSDLPKPWCYHCIHKLTGEETLAISVGDA